MKCPKCGYLTFEAADRCRNCSYEFSLAPSSSAALDFKLDPGPESSRPPLDLDRLIGVPEQSAPDDLPLFSPEGNDEAERSARPGRADGPLRASRELADAPLVSAPLRPRAPLGVRRATPEIPRARARATRPSADSEMLFETPPSVIGHMTGGAGPAAAAPHGDPLAGPGSRIAAGLIDAALLVAVDTLVLYFTLRLLGLTAAEAGELPLVPLVAFFLILNGGYFVAFTAVGGQSIGKMALGIKVITDDDGSVPVSRATLRTLAYIVSALPLGAGFVPGVMSPDRLALHDRLAHTRVVRPSSS